jgi:3-hydroxyisobutyrate dehydrogenase-like beta-hydroxyacid dehydrogenase
MPRLRVLQPSAFWFDLNSVAPATKIETAAAIEQAGARYVEAAIMSPLQRNESRHRYCLAASMQPRLHL